MLRLALPLFATLLQASSPWAMEDLRSQPLQKEVLARETSDGIAVEEIYFTSEVANGKPVRVYGFLACPEDTATRRPGILQLHGGGGTASKPGAISLARNARACVLSIDWSADKKRTSRVTEAGPLKDTRLFGDPRIVAEDLSDFAARHTVRALSRSIDLLSADPRIDPDRIAVFGGSWGGFLSLLIAGLDPRVKHVVSGYGAGAFAGTWSYCSRVMFQQGPQQARFWLDTVDPLLRAHRIRGPVALLTATNELHFWLNTAVKTFEKLPKGSRLIISPNTVHATDHGVRWPTHEWLLHAATWPDVTAFRFDGVHARWKATAPVTRSELYISPGRDNWPGRIWLRVPASIENGEYLAKLPTWLQGAEADAYALITDAEQRSASSIPIHVPGRSTVTPPKPGSIDDLSDGARLWRLLLDNRTKASMEASNGELAIRESRGQSTSIAVETNAIGLLASTLSPQRTLTFDAMPPAPQAQLHIELFELPGQKEERIRRITRTIASAEWQTIRIPLAEFETGASPVTWANIQKLNLIWQSGPHQTWTFRRFRITESSE